LLHKPNIISLFAVLTSPAAIYCNPLNSKYGRQRMQTFIT
jgi:hypothetical protein